jgi:hypothetical protein
LLDRLKRLTAWPQLTIERELRARGADVVDAGTEEADDRRCRIGLGCKVGEILGHLVGGDATAAELAKKIFLPGH